jgi:hypothetical protein
MELEDEVGPGVGLRPVGFFITISFFLDSLLPWFSSSYLSRSATYIMTDLCCMTHLPHQRSTMHFSSSCHLNQGAKFSDCFPNTSATTQLCMHGEERSIAPRCWTSIDYLSAFHVNEHLGCRAFGRRDVLADIFYTPIFRSLLLAKPQLLSRK